MYYLVYKTINKINGRYYIGAHKTRNIEDDYLGSGKLLRRAIAKYGKDSFYREILVECASSKEMYETEKDLVDHKDPMSYNLKPGGMGGFDFVNAMDDNLTHSSSHAKSMVNAREKKYLENPDLKQKAMKKISESRNRQIESGEFVHKASYGFLGKHHTEEFKSKIGKISATSQKGVGNSQFGTIWITDGTISKKISKTNDLPEGFRKGRVVN